MTRTQYAFQRKTRGKGSEQKIFFSSHLFPLRSLAVLSFSLRSIGIASVHRVSASCGFTFLHMFRCVASPQCTRRTQKNYTFRMCNVCFTFNSWFGLQLCAFHIIIRFGGMISTEFIMYKYKMASRTFQPNAKLIWTWFQWSAWIISFEISSDSYFLAGEQWQHAYSTQFWFFSSAESWRNQTNKRIHAHHCKRARQKERETKKKQLFQLVHIWAISLDGGATNQSVYLRNVRKIIVFHYVTAAAALDASLLALLRNSCACVRLWAYVTASVSVYCVHFIAFSVCLRQLCECMGV